MYPVFRDGPDRTSTRRCSRSFGVQVVHATVPASIPRTTPPGAGDPVHRLDVRSGIDLEPAERRSSRSPIVGFGISHPRDRLGAAAARPVADDAAAGRPATTTRTPASSARRCCSCRSSRSSTAASCRPACSSTGSSSTIFSIVQQYLIVGWGGMFPLFGWNPAFAVDHTPRFPVAVPPAPDPTKRAADLGATNTDERATTGRLDRSDPANAAAVTSRRGRRR